MFIIHIPVSSVTVSSTVSVVFSLCFLHVTKKNIDSKNQNGSAKKSDEIHVENKVRRASKL